MSNQVLSSRHCFYSILLPHITAWTYLAVISYGSDGQGSFLFFYHSRTTYCEIKSLSPHPLPSTHTTMEQPSLSNDHIHASRSSLTYKPEGTKLWNLGGSENVSFYWTETYPPCTIYTTQDKGMLVINTVVNKNDWYWKKHGQLACL